jgi:2-methylisocitrate lyase-like PEP mutase family enzyme
MASNDLKAQGDLFRAMHDGPETLVLPNAWDAGSAAIMVDAGFPAIATTSAGVAFANGFPDGENMSRDRMLEAVGRIAQRVDVPVTADLETGYGQTSEDVAETMCLAIEAGIVGANIEDGAIGGPEPLIAIDVMVARLKAVRAATDAVGVTFTINARVDTFIKRRDTSAEDNYAETLKRAEAYIAAGANCIFVPWVTDTAMIKRLVDGIAAPVNLLGATAGLTVPPLTEMQRLGVRRISIGGSLCVTMLGEVRRIVRDIKAGQIDYSAAMTNAEMNAVLKQSMPG